MDRPSASRKNPYHKNYKIWKKIQAAKKKSRFKAMQLSLHRGPKRFKERILEKIKPYWDKAGVTFQDVEEELNSQNRVMMNAVKGIEEKNKKNKILDELIEFNYIFSVIVMIIDIILYGDTLVKIVIKTFNMISILFLILIYKIFTSYKKQNIYELFKTVKDLHDPNNKLINDLLAHREENSENIFETSMKLCLFISRMVKTLIIIMAAIMYLLIPVIKTLITQSISDLHPVPVKIFFIDTDTALGFALNMTHQFLTLFTLLRNLCFAASYVFVLFIFGYFGAESIENFIKSNTNTNVSEKQAWLGVLVDATSLMTKYFSIFGSI